MKKQIMCIAVTMAILLASTGCSTGALNSKNADDYVVNNDNGDSGKISITSAPQETTTAGTKVIKKENLKIGILYIGSHTDTSGYTYAHEQGFSGMASNIGLKEDQLVRKDNIDDGDTKKIDKALDECIEEGCNVIFTTSWGYMEETSKYADKYPDIYFAHGTGYLSNGKNFENYFGRIYQARYLSGIVAGLKTETDKIGYVAAMGTESSEVTGGIDAFAMGVELVNSDAVVEVKVTNSWYDPEGELDAAQELLLDDCDVIAQHCDTTGPQEAAQENGVWSIGYNSDMSKETPDATLVSVLWNWSAYYTSYVSSIIDGTYDGSNYYGGMSEGLVGLSDFADFVSEDTEKKVNEVKKSILDGSFNVFDGELLTNEDTVIGKDKKTLDDETITGGINWYYHNVKVIE